MSSVVNSDDENAPDDPEGRDDAEQDGSSAAGPGDGDDTAPQTGDVEQVGGGVQVGDEAEHDPGGGHWAGEATPAADAELVAIVRAGGKDSAEYRYLKQALEEVAMGTMTKLDKQKKLHREITNKGCRLRRPVPFSYPAHFRTILTLAVLTASPRFMDKQILGGGWKPSGKATVRTFFVSAAMFEFAAEYNRFWVEENPSIPVSPEDLDGADRPESNTLAASYGPNPEELVVNRDRITRIVDEYLSGPEVHPHLAGIIVRTAQQYTQAEIAEDLGLSAEAVSGAIRRFRRRLR